jgi:hypothetical protein
VLRVLDCKRLASEAVDVRDVFDCELCECLLRCDLERKSFDVAAAGEMISRTFDCNCILYFHIFLAEPLREVSEISRLRYVVILAADVALSVMPIRNARGLAAVFYAAVPARPGWVRTFFFFSFHFFFLVWLVSAMYLSTACMCAVASARPSASSE